MALGIHLPHEAQWMTAHLRRGFVRRVVVRFELREFRRRGFADSTACVGITVAASCDSGSNCGSGEGGG